MKERPILFSGPMVRAILDGTKTQTRRIVKLPASPRQHGVSLEDIYRVTRTAGTFYACDSDDSWVLPCPYGEPGDRLWVKETWKPDPSWGYPPNTKPTAIAEGTNILYRATIPEDHPKTTWQKWRPCLFMRRWMSRITLEVVSVRVERLQDISEEDSIAEGVSSNPHVLGQDLLTIDAFVDEVRPMPVARYAALWESINGPGSWDANPWVWVVTFNPDPIRRA